MTHGSRRGLNDHAATRLKTVRMPYFIANTAHPPAGRSRLCGQVVGSPSAGEGPSRLWLVKTPQPDTLSPAGALAAEPQVPSDVNQRNLDKPGQRPPLQFSTETLPANGALVRGRAVSGILE